MSNLRRVAENQYQVFVEYFGGPLATFSSRREANDAMRGYFRTHREKRLEKSPEHRENAPPPLQADFIGDISETGGIGIFFKRGEGMIIVGRIRDIIELMERKEPPGPEESKGLFDALTGYDPQLVEYLLDKYPTHNVHIPIPGCKTDMMKHFWFINRFQQPEAFAQAFPNITLMDRKLLEEWGHCTGRSGHG